MDTRIVAKYGQRRVPRYTSYPTAPHFGPAVDAGVTAGWLSALTPDHILSLYLHIPYCSELCWYCGCHAKATRKYRPVARYLVTLRQEIDIVADLLPGRLAVGHVAWGGGTPSMVHAGDLADIMDRLRSRFDFLPDAEIAMEIDPRTVDPAGLADAGINRVSLGVQSFDETVQRAINRVQTFAETADVADALRASGIARVNLDLMYGLPHQTVASCGDTARQAATLRPDRFAVFGYAHLPSMLKHQRLIDETALPNEKGRLAQSDAIAEALTDCGYVPIGLDHFALPDDPMAIALAEGRLRRNFQGYTDDPTDALIGFGASAIGALPQGYVQNAVPIAAYAGAVADGRLATVRGIALSGDDTLRRHVIETLMCTFAVDLHAAARKFGREPTLFAEDLAALGELARDGVVAIDGWTVTVDPDHQVLVRTVAAAFDAYLDPTAGRHAVAV